MNAKLLVAVGGLLLGAAGGYHVGHKRPAPAAQAPAAAASAERPAATGAWSPALPALLAGAQADAQGDTAPLRAALQQVVREELQALRPQPPTEAEPAKKGEPTPEARRVEEALRSSQQLLKTAHETRRWNREQATEMRQLMAQLDGNGREQVLRDLIPALNRGEVKLEFRGMPF